ncbi:MAG: hypothetical protein WCP77_00045 [Roseococcus sp.]
MQEPAPSWDEAYAILIAELQPQTLPRPPLVSLFDNRAGPGLVTCILPYRADPAHADAEAWLSHPLLDAQIPEGVAFLLVDDGSDVEAADAARAICARLGYSYLRLDTAAQPFSVPRCRNLGAMHARGDFLLMQSLALLPHDGFYADLQAEIEIQDMAGNGKHFLTLPCLQLSQAGTRAYHATSRHQRRRRFLHEAITATGTLAERIAVASEVQLYHRLWYLARGGNSQDFAGGAAAAMELNTRLLRLLRFIPEPPDWLADRTPPDRALEWVGHGAALRAMGDMMLLKGLALCQAWEPEAAAPVGDPAMLRHKMQLFAKQGVEPEPLECAHAGRTLIFRLNAFTAGRLVRPLLGRLVHLRHGTWIRDVEMLSRAMRELGLDRVMFFNPYQSPHMARIQEWVRERGIPYLCAERGALPGSSFFDDDGFLADSRNYQRESWDHPLRADQEALVRRHMADARRLKPTLEAQPPSAGGAALRARLGLAPGEKLLFVPLQRPGDTVTRFQTRGVSYAQFLEEVQAACAILPPGWRIAVKTHPLETEPLPDAAWLNADDAHIHDLLEACDLVWTFNSGVGVLAMLHEKPVLHTGAVFYGAEGLNQPVDRAGEVAALCAAPPGYDAARGLRFLHHLIAEVYSFGEHVTRQTTLTQGGNITATLEIHYEQLNFGGRRYRFINRRRTACPWDSILFDRYRGLEQNLPKPG